MPEPIKTLTDPYPLKGVKISEGFDLRSGSSPLATGDDYEVNQTEYLLRVPGTGTFYARDGGEVQYSVDRGADPAWVRLYLNGQVLVALLHQRKIINFHASSFIYNGLGVIVLGETGAGKSSVTLAFALRRGGFLTDDLTPVVFEGVKPCIMPLHRKVKIRRDTCEQLDIDPSLLSEAESGTGKKYLNLTPMQMAPFPLGVTVKVETGPVEAPAFGTPSPAERFALLRSEVCSWEILTGMPETERAYLEQLVSIIEQTGFIRIVRPRGISLQDFYIALKKSLDCIE